MNDAAPLAEQALALAIVLARASGAMLHLTHVFVHNAVVVGAMRTGAPR